MRVNPVLGRLLMDSGLVPPHCFNVELLMPAKGMATLRYEVMLSREHCEVLSRLFATLGKDITDLE